MGKILITGVSGFLGNHLLDYLSENKTLDRRKLCFLTSKNIDGYHCVLHNDYTYDSSVLPPIDTVIHLGAFCPKTREEANDIQKNVNTVNTCAYLVGHLPNIPKKIVYISTISVYGKKLINYPSYINEETEVSPDLLYGYAKLIGEKIFEEYCRKNSIDLCILRLGVSYGGNDTLFRSGTIPTIVKAIVNRKELKLYNNGSSLKHFIHTYDISRIILEAAIKNVNGIINVVDSKGITILQIVKIMEELSKRTAKLNFIENNSNNDTLFDNRTMIDNFGNLRIDIYTGLKDVYDFCKKMEDKINNVS